jgi:Zn-dependent protease with chaperone function
MTIAPPPDMPRSSVPTVRALTPALTAGRAVYFDGTCSAKNDVLVEIGPTAIQILSLQHRLLDEWSYPELRRMSAPDGMLRLGRSGETLLARLEIRDPALALAIEHRAETLDRGGVAERRLRRKIVGLSIAAGASLIFTAIFGLPVLANRLVPFVPLTVERKLGEAVDKEIRGVLDIRHLGPAFTCGAGPAELPGRLALDTLVGKLASTAQLPQPLRVDVVRRSEANAIALPGGHIYVYDGLIEKAQTPDELAGVLAHEIGHVAHRDGTRAVLQTAGLSFLFGMMLGDFVGGGAVVIAGRAVLRSSYSRRVETAADAYSVNLMRRSGGDPHALGAILARLVGDKDQGMKLLLDHPETKDRIAAIDAAAAPRATMPLLNPAEWSALKQICSSLPPKGAMPAAGETGLPQ